MNKSIRKIKEELKKKAIRATVFHSESYTKDIDIKYFVALDDALEAINKLIDALKEEQKTQ